MSPLKSAAATGEPILILVVLPSAFSASTRSSGIDTNSASTGVLINGSSSKVASTGGQAVSSRSLAVAHRLSPPVPP